MNKVNQTNKNNINKILNLKVNKFKYAGCTMNVNSGN